MGINRIKLQKGSPAEMSEAQRIAAQNPELDAIRQQLFGKDYIQDIGRGQGIAQFYSGFGNLPSLQFTQPSVDTPAVDTSTPVVDTGDGGGGQAITPTTSITDGTNITTPTTTLPFVETAPNILSATDPNTGQPTLGNILDPKTGDVFAPGDYSDVAGTLADPREKIDFTTEQQGTIQNILGQAGQTVGEALSAFGKIPGAIVDAANKTVDIFGQKINIGKTLAGAALNKIAGGPVSLVLGALPERDPRQTKLDELYDVEDGTIQSGLMQGYNPVSGNPLNPTFGLQDAYDDRIGTIENTLKDKYNMSDAEIADVKAGSYTGDVDTNLLGTLVDLEDAKKAEADILGITAAEDKRQSEADIRQTIADAERDFDVTLSQPVTGVEGPPSQISGPQVTTPPSVLSKPTPDNILADTGDAFSYLDDVDLPSGASKTGTPVDALNPINQQQHFDNTQKLKQAITDGKITNEEYNVLSAFDANKTMGLGPVTGTISAGIYQGFQTGAGALRETLGLNPAYAGDQSLAEAAGDTARNIQGVSGNVSPELQVKYQEIISGEDIYRDPILGMVEPPAPMTLADDFGDAFDYFDDVDILQDAPTPTPTPTVPDFISGDSGRDSDPAPSSPVSTAGQAGPPSQRGGGSDIPDRGRGSTPSSSVSTAGQAGPPSQRGGGGGGRDSGGKIVCTMMNESYGFGSFRNKIWIKYARDNLSPEYQKGYHKIFLPLVRLSKKSIVLKKVLEHIAVHRTIDIRQETRGKVHLLGRVYRKILEPICYWVGKYAK